ncbi:MAG: 3-oxoacyl-ACP synthase [Verrucomicrobia bacterium]|nr:MAG: 3-oxoacyl-ACP synthase [Verrucomicrobiota bacterium]
MKNNLCSSIIISGIGTYQPHKILTNADLAQMVDTSDEWIITRTGIKERRIADKNETTSTMGVEAAKIALERAKVSKDDIDLLIVATLSPDMIFPATACLVQQQLGLKSIPCFDLQAACTGFLYALDVASKMMQAGDYKNALIIGSEKMSSILNWHDRSTCVLFGDGAGAVVLSKTNTPNVGIIDSILASDGGQADILCQPAGGSACPPTIESISQGKHFLKMNGKEIFKYAVRLMEQVSNQILQKNNLTPDDIDIVIPHQANIRIIHALATRLNIPIEKFIVNLDLVGNTSAASIPLALNEANEQNKLHKNKYVLLVAFGGGLTWGASLLKWF